MESKKERRGIPCAAVPGHPSLDSGKDGIVDLPSRKSANSIAILRHTSPHYDELSVEPAFAGSLRRSLLHIERVEATVYAQPTDAGNVLFRAGKQHIVYVLAPGACVMD